MLSVLFKIKHIQSSNSLLALVFLLYTTTDLYNSICEEAGPAWQDYNRLYHHYVGGGPKQVKLISLHL